MKTILFILIYSTSLFSLDRAIVSSGINTFHNMGIKGENVLLGVIDDGIDYLHYNFIDSDGNTRVRSLWDQNLHGNAPSGFNYGRYFEYEYINEFVKNGMEFEHREGNSGHGTVVASAMGGKSDKYPGSAPKGEYVVVSLYKNDDAPRRSDSLIVDAIKFILDEAERLNSPVAINISRRVYPFNNLGTNDGNSFLERFIDEEFDSSIPARFISIAAGNEGTKENHLRVGASQNSPFTVELDFKDNDFEQPNVFVLNIVTKTSSTITAVFTDMDNNQSETLSISHNSPNPKVTSTLSESSVFLQRTDFYKNSPAALSTYAVIGDSDSRKTVGKRSITIYPESEDEVDFFIGSISNDSIKIISPVFEPSMTIISPAYSKKALTVGMYVTRFARDSETGEDINWPEIGNIFSISARGFSRDSHIKPEIAAPGGNIMVAYSRYSNNHRNHPYSMEVPFDTNSQYYITSGTSIASPIACGLAALLFEVNSNLSQQDIKDIFIEHALVDEFVSRVNVPDPQWGYGKLYLDARDFIPVFAANTDLDVDHVKVFPNPFNSKCNIEFRFLPNEDKVSISIFDISARKVDKIVVNRDVNVSELSYRTFWNPQMKVPSGIYFFNFDFSSGRTATKKGAYIK